MAAHSNTSGPSLLQLSAANKAEGEIPAQEQQLENESRVQMDLYDDLIGDIIGVPLNNEVEPKKDNLECTSNNILVPIKADPSKSCDSEYIDAPLHKKLMLIGNLTWWTTGDDLLAAVHSAGISSVDDMKFYEVAKGGQSKGFASVTLSLKSDIQRLLKILPKKEVHGRYPDVRHFTKANYQYFETQFINAMEKSKLHSAHCDIFGRNGNDNQFVFDLAEEGYPDPVPWRIQQKFSTFINLRSLTKDPTVPDKTFPLFPHSSMRQIASLVETKLHHGSTPFSTNNLLQNLTSLAVPPVNISAASIPSPVLNAFPHFFFKYLTSLGIPLTNIPAPLLSTFPRFLLQSLPTTPISTVNVPIPVLSGYGLSQISQACCVNPATFITPTITGLSTLDNNKTPPVYNTCHKDYKLSGRETGVQETLQSTEEPIKELDSKGTFSTIDDGDSDYGNLLQLVSFVKKSKAIAPDGFRDSVNYPPNQLHEGEASQSSLELRERKYTGQRKNRISRERSGHLRDRSRSPGSCDSYQEKRMDYDHKRQQCYERSYYDNSPSVDQHWDSRGHGRDSRGLERDSRGLERDSRGLERDSRGLERDSRGRERDRFDRDRDSSDRERHYFSKKRHFWDSDLRHGYSEKIEKGHCYSEGTYCKINQKRDREY
ncbi:cleavage and polyadenylation specificity factor subunit 6-like isoform X1 [Stegostoma tigrinum]|uniref:cleavage and polyadenylation specificity factor subunit 6-like isoform X1 n=1 Tax=Stegostoma tigrinum TaxID=3053191 RepID=UPI00202B9CE7|nr:cleavage and polyadenylation specificity factor subunit 6-like isoform X1 [Stegostoma tigrinum]